MTEDAPVTETEADEFIIASNLQKMEVDMMNSLMGESLGGYAGSVERDGKRIPCAAANGYANRETGEIVAFGNPQNVPLDIRENNFEFTHRVALDFLGDTYEVVRTDFSRMFSGKARANIDEATSRYNEKHAHQKTPNESG